MNLPALTSLGLLVFLSQGVDKMPARQTNKIPKAAQSQQKRTEKKRTEKKATEQKRTEQKATKQEATKKEATEQKKPERKATDHDSIDTLVAALYDVISGPKGEERDWKRFASLFHVGGRLQALSLGRDGKRRYITMTPEDYVKRSGKWAETNGLFEKETHREQDVYGHIAQVFSAYELRVGDDALESGKKADLVGINSIQCCQLDGKWRILSILWEDARSAGPIPDRYLGKPASEIPGQDEPGSRSKSGSGSKKDGDDRK